MASTEDLTNFDVFLIVALYFIGVAVGLLSLWYGRLLGVSTGLLVMVVAYLYERVSILEEEVRGGA